MLVFRNFKKILKEIKRQEKKNLSHHQRKTSLSLTVGLTNKETLKKYSKKYENIFSSISFPRVPSRYV